MNDYTVRTDDEFRAVRGLNPVFKKKFLKCILMLLLLSGVGNIHAQTYCTPTGAQNCSSYGDRINRVKFANLDNITNACSSGGYGNFTSSVANVVAGQTYKMSVSVANGGTEYVTVFIDFDQNGTFAAGETFHIGSGNNVTITNDIAIPTTALTGNTRMRVRCKYNAAITDPCVETGGYGEVEDYTVNISTRATCLTYVASLASTNPTSCSANNGTITVTPTWGNTGSSLLWYRNTFNGSATPSTGSSTISGNATSINNYMRLTDNAGSQAGSLVVSNPNGFNASAVQAEFNLYMGDGTSADGFSFSYGGGVAHGQGENGTGSGVSLRFDSYNNSGQSCAPTSAGQVSVGVYYDGTLVPTACINAVAMRGLWQNVFIYINVSNQLTLRVGNTTVISNLALPAGYASANKSAWQWGFSARTGGAYDYHIVDNINLYANNQPEYSINNTTWQTSNVFSGLAPGTYTVYMRTRQSNADCTGSNSVGSVTLTAPAYTTPTPSAANQWNVSCYNGSNFDTYYGYYTQTTLGFNTTTKWSSAGSPSSATAVDGLAYSGCTIPVDYHSYKYERHGFPCGKYTFSIEGHDDEIEAYIDANGDGDASDPGDYTFTHLGCCDAHANLWTGYLSSTSQIIIRTKEGVGGSNTEIKLVNVTPTITTGSLSLNGTAGNISTCAGTPVAITQAGGTYTDATYCYWIGTDRGDGWVDAWDTWNGANCNTNTPPNITFNTPGNYVIHTNGYNSTCGWDYYGLGSTRLVSVHAPSTAPTGVSGAGVTICPGNTVTLTQTGGSLSSGASYQWYQGSCGGTAAVGTLSGTGNSSITVSPTSTTTYYVRAGAGTGCAATACANGTVTLPAMGTALATNGQSATCNVSGNNWIHFYTSGGNLIASINPNGNNLGSVTATAYVGGGAALTQACGTGSNPSFTTAALGRSWLITPTNNLPASVRFPFAATELAALVTASATTTVNALDNVSVIGDLKMSHYSGPNNLNGSWSDNCTSAGGSGGTQLVGTQGGNGLTSTVNGFLSTIAGSSYVQFNTPGFSEFWLHGDGGTSPLPVQLINFSATCNEKGDVNINWSTASEHNSQKFIVEKSRDLDQWIVAGERAASGNSNYKIDYFMADNDAFGGVSYYRLVQVDNDGAQEIFGPVSVSCSSDENSMIVFPNPSKGSFTVEITSTENIQHAGVQLTDLTGKVISVREVNIYEGKNQLMFEGTDLQAGTYIVKVVSKSAFSPVRVVMD